jgi:hypothetical protein
VEVQNRGFYFRLWLTSISSPILFPAAEAAWKRVKRAIESNREGFIIFAVRDGRTYALNLHYVQMGEFFSEEEPFIETANQRSSEIRLYLAGRGAEAFRSADPKELAAAFTALQTGSHEGVLTFSEKNGSTLMVRTNELMLLESWTEYVEDGFRQALEEKRSQKE